ncbi:MAG: DUF6178 family protein [Myxococcota bacterium]|jgi:hypothetical protein|nr:DUF6178 family protein [Myxococcota bacterium]
MQFTPTLFGQSNSHTHAEGVLEALESMSEPGPLVQALAPLDLIVAWNLADDEKRLDLFKLASFEQIQNLVDITCWQGDTPDYDSLLEVLRPAALSSIPDAILALGKIEPSLRTLLLGRKARIHVIENRNDEVVVDDESDLLSAPDGFFHVELPDPDAVSEPERMLWRALLFQPFDQYHRELEAMRWELQSDLEEQAYRFRTGRLADLGFLPREEAVSSLVPRTVEEIQWLARAVQFPRLELDGNRALPVLYRECLRGAEFFDEVIGELLQNGSLDRQASLSAELGVSTNQFVTALGTPLHDTEAVRRTTKHYRNLLSLGLELCSYGDVREATRLLSALVPGLFVSVALGRLYPLGRRAAAVLRNKRLGSLGQPASALDPVYHVALELLARQIPLPWPGLAQGADTSALVLPPLEQELAGFSTELEVQAHERLLEEAERLPWMLGEAMRAPRNLPGATPASVLLLNALANAAAGREPTPEPVSYAEAVEFGERVVASSEDALVYDAITALSSAFELEPSGGLELDADPDPARRLLVRLVLIGLSRLRAAAPQKVLLLDG